jgi:hypothetical protein
MSVAPRAWLYHETPVSLPIGVPVGAHAHTPASPGSLKRHAIVGRLADGRTIDGEAGELRQRGQGRLVLAEQMVLAPVRVEF